MATSDQVDRREPCPRCRAGGADRSGDNLVVYKDGHKHCYSCGRHEFADTWVQIQQLVEDRVTYTDVPDELDFPNDYMPLGASLYSKGALTWLRSYGITDSEIQKWRIGWSAERMQLIFPVWDVSGRLLMYQARNFNGGPKYLTKGEKRDIMHLVGNSASGTVIITEDLVSAIKVGREYQAMPIWGAEVGLGLLKKLAERFDNLGVWLDSNKIRDAVKIALRASQYMPSFVVSSLMDPKDYSVDMIRKLVKDGLGEALYHSPSGALTRGAGTEEVTTSTPTVPVLMTKQHPTEYVDADGNEIDITNLIPDCGPKCNTASESAFADKVKRYIDSQNIMDWNGEQFLPGKGSMYGS